MAKKKLDVKIGVVGSGSFATAIVKILSVNCKTIHWMVRNEFVKGAIENKKHNPNYLSSVEFNTKQLIITTNINEIVSACDIIILATPSIYLPQAMEGLVVDIKEKTFVSAIKGIVPDVKDIVAHYLDKKFQIPLENQAVISGPCHAEEVAMERLSYLTVSSLNDKTRLILAKLLSNHFIRITQSNDVLGNEYSSILKNIYAIAAGLIHGLGYGDNYKAVFLSNAIREMDCFLQKLHPNKDRSINCSASLGDLLVTSYSLFSRNRMLGTLIGKGYTVKSAIQSMSMIAEGYYATQGIYELAQSKNLKLPIVSSVYQILFENANVEKTIEKLSDKMN